MQTFGHYGLLIGAAAVVGPEALCQALDEAEFDIGLRAVTVFSPGGDNADGVDAEEALYELGADISASARFQSGVEIGLVLTGRLQRDHPARPGFGGRIGPGLEGEGLAPRGAFTGLTAGGPVEDVGPRAALETGFVYLRSGYGEWLAGRDLGVAARFYRGAPSVFTHASASNARLDPTGIATVRTEADVTGRSFKLTYTTPRLLGVRAGVSYTPRSEANSLDRDPGLETPGVAPLRLDNTFEAAINASRVLPLADIRVRAHASYATSGLETGEPLADAGRTGVVSFGGSVGKDWLTLGGSWLRAGNGGGRYRAWSVGAGGDAYGFEWSAEYGQSDDALIGVRGRSWNVGAGRRFGDRIRFSLGIQGQRVTDVTSTADESVRPVLEMTLTL